MGEMIVTSGILDGVREQSQTTTVREQGRGNNNTPVIRVEGLVKSFGHLPVLRQINLQLHPGRVTAIVGPNGSGKTTLIKCILGLARPDRGSISVLGEMLNGNWRYRRHIGYMPQIGRFPENLRVREVLAMIKDLRQGEQTLDEELIDAFQLEAEMEKPLRTLSGGNRQKVSAVIAFLFRPVILILDEPTAGLDPLASHVLKEKVRRERARDKTIIITSHIMSEVEAIADELVFLLDGRVLYHDRVDKLKKQMDEANLERAIGRLLAKQEVRR